MAGKQGQNNLSRAKRKRIVEGQDRIRPNSLVAPPATAQRTALKKRPKDRTGQGKKKKDDKIAGWAWARSACFGEDGSG